MFDSSRTRFHGKKAVQDFFGAVSKVFDRVYTENRSPMVRKNKKIKNKKDHKGLRFCS
jgi:hypothetical protein